MRIGVAGLKACMGIVAVCWTTGGIAAPAGTASSTGTPPVAKGVGTASPAIRLLPTQPGLAGTCGGSAFAVNTFIDVSAQSSADVKVSALGVGTIEQFTDETGKNIGPYNAAFPTFQILAFGGGLAPNTPVTITITTYSGSNLSGAISFVSTLEFDCTTGAVILAQPPLGSVLPTPALSPLGLAATAALLVLLGGVMLRRPARQRRARR